MMSLLVWFTVLVCRRCRNGRPTKANSPTNQDKTHKLHSGNADTVPMCGVQWWNGSRNGTENQGEKAVKNRIYLNPFEQDRAEINLDDCKLGLVKHCSRTENETQLNSLKDFTECKQEINEDIREYATPITKIGKEILSSCPDGNINEIMKNQFALGLNDLTARKIVLEKILKYRQSRKPLSLNDLVDKLTIREIAINSINKAEELKNIKLTPKLGKTERITEDREPSREVPFSTGWADESVIREVEQTTESNYPNYRNNYNTTTVAQEI